MKYFLSFLAGVLCTSVAFLVFYKNDSTYITNPTQVRVIEKPTLVKEYRTEFVALPTRRDTLRINGVDTVYTIVDTSAIIAEYSLKREYSDTVKTDSAIVTVSSELQCNRLLTTKVGVRVLQKQPKNWIVSGEIVTGFGCGVGFGRFFGEFGVGARYDFIQNSIGLQGFYRF